MHVPPTSGVAFLPTQSLCGRPNACFAFGAHAPANVLLRQGGDAPALTLRVAHDDLEQCVGQATAAFGLELLRGDVAPGVWYPAELDSASRGNILQKAREDAIVWEM